MTDIYSIETVRWLPMSFALLIAFGLFGYVMIGKIGLLFASVHRPDLFTNLGGRTKSLFVNAIGQKKMFRPKKELRAGLMHAFIFWGFLVLQIRTLYLILIAFVPDFHIPLIHNEYAFAKDITELVVLGMVTLAAYRRLFNRPDRLTLSIEAVVVLGMIGGLIITDLLYDAFLFAEARVEHGELFEQVNPVLAEEARYAFVGNALSYVVDGMSSTTLLIGKEIFYWVHIFIVLTFLNMLPGSKHFHVITSLPNSFFAEVGRKKGALHPIEDIEKQEKFGVGEVTDFDWRDVLDLYTCTECGRCQVNCPTTITGKVLNPKLLVCDIRDHLYAREDEILGRSNGWDDTEIPSLIDWVKKEAIWDCTTCRACADACPVSIEHIDKIVDMRRHLVLMEADMPSELSTTLRNLEQKGNPWGMPQSDRMNWAKGADVPLLADKPDAEYVFWVGCAGAYDDNQKKVTAAMCELMDRAGVSYAVMGELEQCTGELARRAGNEYLFQILAKSNIETLKELGADKKKLITHCPHCFNTIANEYPQFGGMFEMVHHTQLLDRLVADGKLTPRKTPEGASSVTFHDSCYLGRYNDVYDQPRNALKAIPGVELREMERHKSTGMCCGAGGARFWMEEHKGARINHTRVEQAMETQASTVAVGCPFCNQMLADGSKDLEVDGKMQTKDVAQLLLESLD